MRPTRLTLSAAGTSNVVPMDLYANPFNVGLGVTLSTGANLTYSVQHTFDDVFAEDFDPATANWFSNSGLTAKTVSTDGNYAFAVTGIRLNVTSYTAGSATLTVAQAGGGCK